MNTIEAIYARKSVRKFKDEVVRRHIKNVRSSNSSSFSKTSTKLELRRSN